jgi:hypothetical protein
MKTFICKNCGIEFKGYNNRKYCSIKCRAKSKEVYTKMCGKKYGRLTVIEKDIKTENKYICRCECGNIKSIDITSISTGRVKSCGCITKEKCKIEKPHLKHDKTKTRIYNIYNKMKNRYYNPNYFQYYLYGGKGIKVCKEWKDNFINFYNWAMNNGYKDNLSIDRIDGNKGYSPDNCRWATAKEQCRNLSTNINIEYKGQTHCLTEWAEILNINVATLYWRYKHWNNIEKIFKVEV